VIKIKPGYDYSYLDDAGLIKENTPLDDKVIVIGKITSNLENKDVWYDDSIKTKKGQLGFVDKSFITEGEEGFNLAKVRIREERIPAIGDKMASRAGQKGTLGLIIPEQDMPFTADGIRPDLIINPHAIPSRMTIGQIIESLFGKVCTSYGGFGDCTAFQVKGSNYSTYAPLLVNAGFNSTGNQVLYNGMSGEQIQSDIYIGPTYYMRLKHMVKDKINYRARGPNQALTRQAVQGRANDGGLRIGEMERDGVLAHGMSYFLNESFLVRGDEYYMAVCNKTGAIAIYNDSRNLFLSPFADGPIQFHTNPDGSMNIKNISRFGRSFSLLRIPYSFKLLIQELQVMNVQMRIITDENIDQMMSLSYSNNIFDLLQLKENSTSMANAVSQYSKYINEKNHLRPATNATTTNKVEEESPESIPYAEGSPAFEPTSPIVPTTAANEESISSVFDPTKMMEQVSSLVSSAFNPTEPASAVKPAFPEDLNLTFAGMSREEQNELLKKPEQEQVADLKQKTEQKESSILEVEEPKEEEENKEEGKEENQSSSISGEKKIIFTGNSSSLDLNENNASNNKKIIL
jgi:translation initiation factor 2B subunit (eIF-2B alpha/beta/delta family)